MGAFMINEKGQNGVKMMQYNLLMLIVTAFLFDLTFRNEGNIDTVIVLILQMVLIVRIILSKAKSIQTNEVFEALTAQDANASEMAGDVSGAYHELVKKIFSLQNGLNGLQLTVGYVVILKLIGGILLKQSPFDVAIQGMTLLFFVVAAFILLPLLLWVKNIDSKRLRNQIQLVVFLLLLFWITMDGQGATLPTFGKIYLMNNLLAGVDYMVAIVICQYIQKFMKA
jgi:Ca2+/Na+ antiporter